MHNIHKNTLQLFHTWLLSLHHPHILFRVFELKAHYLQGFDEAENIHLALQRVLLYSLVQQIIINLCEILICQPLHFSELSKRLATHNRAQLISLNLSMNPADQINQIQWIRLYNKPRKYSKLAEFNSLCRRNTCQF